FDGETFGDLAASGKRLSGDQAATVTMPSLLDVERNVAGRQKAAPRRRLPHEAPHSRPPLEPAVGGKLAQRPVHRHPAQAEARHQLVLRRNPGTRPEFAGGDAGSDVFLDLEIARPLRLPLLAHRNVPRTQPPSRIVA